jgi:hypothetical protein
VKLRPGQLKDKISFTSVANMPFGTEFRMIGPIKHGGSATVSIAYPSGSTAEISLQEQFLGGPTLFVVMKQFRAKNAFSYVAASSESIVSECRSIEDAIFVGLSNHPKSR